MKSNYERVVKYAPHVKCEPVQQGPPSEVRATVVPHDSHSAEVQQPKFKMQVIHMQ